MADHSTSDDDFGDFDDFEDFEDFQDASAEPATPTHTQLANPLATLTIAASVPASDPPETADSTPHSSDPGTASLPAPVDSATSLPPTTSTPAAFVPPLSGLSPEQAQQKLVEACRSVTFQALIEPLATQDASLVADIHRDLQEHFNRTDDFSETPSVAVLEIETRISLYEYSGILYANTVA
ncbi:hypothetical protein BJ085DRAFT_27581 [Dimargaris cristalligena]|uniref:Uncharacterized protein n=1 Tax=Dimargaris cristalligena TaxID=215637 RepID=A0A4V1J3Z1_9FUNG|nr:hypothetical protein BJ085DRAFT_27581 [Dimargaris cristalligena]|eukprot:RKP33739.1 hypothetical protein BJ085DRAFT_27581 [Dimargaris cristalligena]